MIRRCPLVWVVSLRSAFMLSAVWALATIFLVALTLFFFKLRLVLGDGVLDVQVRVPDRQERLAGEGAHRRPVALGPRQDDLAAVLGGEAVVPPGHGQAGRQPLDIPLERAGQELVEVVDVKHQPPRGRGERAEIGQVRIPAQLHPQPRAGGGGQVGRHRQRRPPEERERRHQHPPVPDRQQFRHPALFLFQQQPDRIATDPARTPPATPAKPPPGRCASRSARLSCSSVPARTEPLPDARAAVLRRTASSVFSVMTVPSLQGHQRDRQSCQRIARFLAGLRSVLWKLTISARLRCVHRQVTIRSRATVSFIPLDGVNLAIHLSRDHGNHQPAVRRSLPTKPQAVRARTGGAGTR